MKKLTLLALITVLSMFSACVVVHPGQVALKVQYGKIKPGVLLPGAYVHAPFGTKLERFNTRIIEYSDELGFHSVEGIEVTSEITVLYHLIPDSVSTVFQQFNGDYEKSLIVNNIIAALRQEGLNHNAVELITQRSEIEQSIQSKLTEVIGAYGFHIDLVLMKEIHLPDDVRNTIRAKLNAEQLSKKLEIDLTIHRQNLDFNIEKEKKEAELNVDKQRIALDFSLEKQRKESERLRIESEGIKQSQEIISSSLTDQLIRYKALEITQNLVRSPNTKIIITDGKSPVILSEP